MEHYFTNNQNLKSEIRKLTYKYQDEELEFLSDNGVFSKNKIDYASKLLVEAMLEKVPPDNKSLLDVGCGYGYIGITLGKLKGFTPSFADVNKRALHLCKRNIKLNNIKGKVIESNIYENISEKYDYIVTNPPIRAGKEVVLSILQEAKNHLKEDGELWFVINKDQGAKSTKKILESCYDIEVIKKNKGFYCFRAKFCWQKP